jgi:uncharacterized protein DUF4244
MLLRLYVRARTFFVREEGQTTAEYALVILAAAALAAAPGLDPSLVSLQVSRTGARGEPVSVAVGYDAPVRLPAIAWLFGTTVRLDSSAVDRQEFG